MYTIIIGSFECSDLVYDCPIVFWDNLLTLTNLWWI